MGTVKSLLLGMCFVLGACTSQTSTVQTTEKGTQWEWQNGTIVVKTPERPAGQKSVLGLTTPKLEAVRVGFFVLSVCHLVTFSNSSFIFSTPGKPVCLNVVFPSRSTIR